MLLGLEAPPSSRRRSPRPPRRHRQAAASIDLNGIAGQIAGSAGARKRPFRPRRRQDALRLRPMSVGTRCRRCSARWSRGSGRRRPRRCLGAIGGEPRHVWPSRGFRFGRWRRPKATSSSTPRRSRSARRSRSKAQRLLAKADKKGLAVTSLDGAPVRRDAARRRVALWPRGAGAELEAKADVKGARLDDASQSSARQRPRQRAVRSFLLGVRAKA